MSSSVMCLGGLARARIAEASGAQRDAAARRPAPRRAGSRAGARRDRRSSSSPSPPRIGRRRSARRSAPCGRPLRVPEREQLLQQPAGQAARRACAMRSMPTRSRWRRPIVDGRDAQVVQRAVLEARLRPARAGARAPARSRSSPCRPRTTAAAAAPARRAAPAGSRRRSGSRTSCRTRSVTKSGRTASRSSRLVGTNAAASSSTSQPRACASSTRSSGCFTPEKFDCAGNANRVAARRCRRRRAAPPASSRSMRSSGNVSGAYSTAAPLRRARTRRMPFTELWLSAVSSSRPPGANGYALADQLQRAAGVRVKIADVVARWR